jgi:hypothetical protein
VILEGVSGHLDTESRSAQLQPSRRIVRRDTALVFLAVFSLLAALTYGTPLSFDGQVMYAVARAITHGRLHLLLGEPPFMVRPTGAFAAQFPYSHYGIGVTLVILPLYVMARVLHLSSTSTNLVVLLANPLITAGAAAVLYRIGLALTWPRRLAVAVALAFGLLTMMAQDGTELFSEPGVALGIGLLLLGLLRWRQGRVGSGLLAGTGIAIAIIFRDDSVVLVAPALLAAIFMVDRRTLVPRLQRQWVAFLLPLVPVSVWTTYYSHLASCSWVPHTYGGNFNTPFWTGFYGQLFGPNKGFFFYNPWLLLAIPGVWLLARRELSLTVVLIGLFVARILFYARWNYWYGGGSVGTAFRRACRLADVHSRRRVAAGDPEADLNHPVGPRCGHGWGAPCLERNHLAGIRLGFLRHGFSSCPPSGTGRSDRRSTEGAWD